jgi:hypothetical protein
MVFITIRDGEIKIMGNTATILDSQSISVAIGQAVDEFGFPTGAPPAFDAPPAWTATPAGANLAPSADGLSCVLGGAPGQYTVNVAGTVGGNPESATGTLTVTPGAAVSFQLNFGAATNNAPPAAAPVTPASS